MVARATLADQRAAQFTQCQFRPLLLSIAETLKLRCTGWNGGGGGGGGGDSR